MRWSEDTQAYDVLEDPRKEEVEVWPTVTHGGTKIEKNWERGWERVRREVDIPNEYRVRRGIDSSGEKRVSIDFVQRMDPSSVPKTWWGDAKYASSNYGAMALKGLFGENPFDFAKSVALVEDCIRTAGGGERTSCIGDFFGGSGTAGHAAIEMNRDDNGERKYILVEMGYQFDTVLLPRLKKVVYSQDWKNGRPVLRDRGVSQLMKYVRLESYEDSLDGLIVTPSSGDLLASHDGRLVEDYRLRYALGQETASSPCLLGEDFTDPFAYTISVVRDGVRCEKPVDLPETFNFLLGLRVEFRRNLDDVLAIAGMNWRGQRCLVLWRNLAATDNDSLEGWFVHHRVHLPNPIDLVYVNGDHTLNAVRKEGETWSAETIEPLFRNLMFEVDEQ